MLKQIDMAVLGGHFMNDPEINKYERLVKELLEQYDPTILSDCYIEYQNALKPELYIYAEQRSKTIESALEILNNESIQSLGYGLTKENLNNIEDAFNILKDNYKDVDIIYNDTNLQDNVKIKQVLPSANSYLNNVIGIDGFQKGRSYVFASRAKGGKSLFLQNLAQKFDNQKVLYLSLENDLEDIYSRLVQMRNRNGNYNNYDILYKPKTTTENIKDLCKNYDIIIVDYLARILPPKELEKESLYTIYGEIADKLHYIANETDTCIITACQLNRSALSVFKDASDKNKWTDAFYEIDQDSLSDSMGIVRNSDSVSVVWFKDHEFHVHNIASRVQTKYEYIYCDTYNNNTIEMTTKGGVYV